MPSNWHLGFFRDWRNFGNLQESGGRTYFALLADRFITYTNQIGSSAARALVNHLAQHRIIKLIIKAGFFASLS